MNIIRFLSFLGSCLGALRPLLSLALTITLDCSGKEIRNYTRFLFIMYNLFKVCVVSTYNKY